MAHNKAEILRVADAIEQHSIADLGFNMAVYRASVSEYNDLGNDEPISDRSGHGCNTVACIAGWVDATTPGRAATKPGRNDTSEFAYAARVFGLTGREASALFMPRQIDMEVANPAQAVAVLRHLAETGVVDWSIA